MNVIKKYFTLKRVFIFFAVVFVALFCAANFSTALMDWQFYKAEYVSDKCSGVYVYDRNLYEEIRKHDDEMGISNGITKEGYLPNGIPNEMYVTMSHEILKKLVPNDFSVGIETFDLDTQYSRIWAIGTTLFFIDNSGNKHIVYQIREYIQRYFAISISGDEGRGWRLNTWRYYYIPSSNNTFYIKEHNNAIKGICE